jgi:hypothetical protein
MTGQLVLIHAFEQESGRSLAAKGEAETRFGLEKELRALRLAVAARLHEIRPR